MAETRVCVGLIVGAHGVRGGVRVKSFTHNPADVAAYGALADESGVRSFALSVTGTVRGAVLAKIDGVADRNAAEALKGTRLFAPRDRFPALADEEYYHADLVGLAAEREDGTALGRVRAVHNFGAGDMLEIDMARGGTVAVPFTKRFVPVVDMRRGRVVVGALGELLPAGSAPRPGRGGTRRRR